MPGTTEHFALKIALPTDNYNHLSIDNEAYKAIDAQMYKNQNAAFTTATHSKQGTVHVLSKSIGTCSVLRFMATDDFRAGDSFSVDSSVVEAKTSSGSSLPDYAFTRGSNVIAILNGGFLTVVVPEFSRSKLIDTIYPVGSVYMSFNATSPNQLFGGSWAKIEGRFLLGASGAVGAGTTGGEEKVYLTANELPNHYHAGLTIDANPVGVATSGGGGYGLQPVPGTLASQWVTAKNGDMGNQAHNNMPPYIGVHIWQRVG